MFVVVILTEFYPYVTYTVENTDKISYIPLTKVCLVLNQYSGNLNFLNGFACRFFSLKLLSSKEKFKK